MWGIDREEDFHPMYVPRFVKSALVPMYREFKNDVAFRRSFEGFPPPLDRTMRRVSRTRFSCSDEHNIPGWLTANERRALLCTCSLGAGSYPRNWIMGR